MSAFHNCRINPLEIPDRRMPPHISLVAVAVAVAVAQDHGHDCFHVNWFGLSGETDWDLMPRIVGRFHLRDEQRSRLSQALRQRTAHAGLVIIVPQVLPALQRELFVLILRELAGVQYLVNEVLEVTIEEDTAVLTRYLLPET
ncbi:toxin-antitoxin system, toxin component, PIN family protein [Rhizobium leguminosarum]|uniref:toxin-antitoxin system, toxin component, PIN family protein n=1 Tax=Rhizobium leguminosarum TaxID=384 RepID=UPI001FE0E7FA|nr:toxin-antitoxin system, toxin component, PIN family protein [Rhizobium leguminosarum]